MSNFKGTPGPWMAYESRDDRCFYIAQQDGAPFTPDYSDVCGLACNTWSGERHTVQAANARLIAAAPELLEALQAFEASADLWLPANVGEDRVHEAEALHQLRHKASAAIAKALNTDTTER